MDARVRLQMTVAAPVQAGKGNLAADESGPTIAKRFKSVDGGRIKFAHEITQGLDGLAMTARWKARVASCPGIRCDPIPASDAALATQLLRILKGLPAPVARTTAARRTLR